MLLFGELAVQTPSGARLGSHHWERLECALIWAADGLRVSAKRMLAGLEADLQREESLRARAAEARSDRQRAIAVHRMHLPEAERGLNEEQAKRADKLLRRIGDKTLPKHKREAARDELSAAEEGRRQSAEQGAMDVHLAMLARLEAGRDPTAPLERDKLGRLRVMSRDGLECLKDIKQLTVIQFDAGMRYRDLYEATERSIRSNLNRDISGVEDKRQLADVGQKIQARNRLEAKVTVASKNGRGLATLRLIAGQGRTLYALAPKSNANQALYKAAFLVALDVCADHWGMQ